MYRFRISVSGAEPVTQGAIEALVAAGAHPVGEHEPRVVVWSSPAGIERLESVSLLHRGAAFGVEGFLDFENRRRYAMVVDGETTVLHDEPILPPGWGGGWYDEEGAPLDAELVAWAGGLLGAHERVPHGSTLGTGTETALVAARRLGEFAQVVSEREAGAETMKAVVELGQLGVDVSLAGSFRTYAELEYHRALAVTKAALHAGRDELGEAPGEAAWKDWLGTLLQSASSVVDYGCWADVEPHPDAPSPPPWVDCPAPKERMEHAGHALATTCIQVIALFGGQVLQR